MNNTQPTAPAGAAPPSPDLMTHLFADMVVQHSNMALMFLGQMAHPETGQTFKDMDAARLFIDQLEMLEVKTKGNLTAEESGLLKQSLMALRLAFVEAVRAGTPQEGQEASPPPANAPAPADTDEEHRRKFSKKY